MAMEWNEFNRELQNRVSDPGLRFILGMIYERVLDISKQQMQIGEALLGMAETMSNIVSLTDIQDERIKTVAKALSGERAGVELSSVPLTND